MKPVRIQLSRRKGWRMPPNTVKVDRSTKWGNPFIVGTDGTRAQCVEWFRVMLAGHICISMRVPELPDAQIAYMKHARRYLRQLRGKNLACWCPLSAPCHVDVLLEIANK
jgi:hypothetical protein